MYRGLSPRQGAPLIAIEPRQFRGQRLDAGFKRRRGTLSVHALRGEHDRFAAFVPLAAAQESLGHADQLARVRLFHAHARIGQQGIARATRPQHVDLRFGDAAGAFKTQGIGARPAMANAKVSILAPRAGSAVTGTAKP